MKERLAFYCDHADHLKPPVMAFRVFLLPGENVGKCPTHNRRLVRQANRPYNLRATIAAAKAVTDRYKGVPSK